MRIILTLIFLIQVSSSFAQLTNNIEINAFIQSSLYNIQPIGTALILNSNPQAVNPQKGKYHLSGCKKYQATIKLTDNSKSLKGCLYSLGNSSISFYPNHMLKKSYDGVLMPLDIGYDKIEKIKLYKRGNVSKGLGFGALSGFVLGAAITGVLLNNGNSDSYAPPVGVACLVGGAMGSIPGLLVGAAVGGSIGVKIKIKGDMDKFKSNKKRLKLYDAK